MQVECGEPAPQECVSAADIFDSSAQADFSAPGQCHPDDVSKQKRSIEVSNFKSMEHKVCFIFAGAN